MTSKMRVKKVYKAYYTFSARVSPAEGARSGNVRTDPVFEYRVFGWDASSSVFFFISSFFNEYVLVFIDGFLSTKCVMNFYLT